MERLIVMEIDVLPFKILVSYSSCVLVEMVMEAKTMEMAVERQGSAPKGVYVCVACSLRRLGFPSLNRHPGGRFREPIELGIEYSHRAFTDVVPFEETKPTEPSTTVQYGRGLPVPMVTIGSVCFRILAAISSYELRLRCSLACWTRMDEGYNPTGLYIKYKMLEKYHFFPHLIWLSLVLVTLSYHILLVPFAFIYP